MLARAILEYLHGKGVRTAVTTHISQLKTLGYTLAGVENASIEFDVNTLKPTHKVLIGMAGSSNALVLARRLGLPEAVIDEAEGNRQGDRSAELLDELQAARVQTLADREQAQAAVDEARRMREKTRRTLEDAQAQEELSKVSNGQAAYGTLRDLKKQVEQLRQDEPSKRSLLLALGQLVAAIDKELARAPHVEVKGSPEVGDRVLVRSLGRVGVLSQIDTRTGKAVVDLGAAPVTVALEEVEAA